MNERFGGQLFGPGRSGGGLMCGDNGIGEGFYAFFLDISALKEAKKRKVG